MRVRGLLLTTGVLSIMTIPCEAQVFSFTGAGPVQLGMTLEAAERAMGTTFAPIAIPFSDECWITHRGDGKDPATDYVIQNGKVVRIDFEPQHGEQLNAKTTFGIGIGSTEADIRLRYQGVSKTIAPYYDEESEIEAAKLRAERGDKEPQHSPPYQVRVNSPDNQRGIIFVTQDSKVISFMTGFKNAIESMEICR